MNFEHVSDSVDCIDMQVEWRESEGYVNKEVCFNIELFLLVFVRVVHSQLANECLMVSYGFLPSILQVWVAEGWQVVLGKSSSYFNTLFAIV